MVTLDRWRQKPGYHSPGKAIGANSYPLNLTALGVNKSAQSLPLNKGEHEVRAASLSRPGACHA
jgi:hypothetical protein